MIPRTMSDLTNCMNRSEDSQSGLKEAESVEDKNDRSTSSIDVKSCPASAVVVETNFHIATSDGGFSSGIEYSDKNSILTGLTCLQDEKDTSLVSDAIEDSGSSNSSDDEASADDLKRVTKSKASVSDTTSDSAEMAAGVEIGSDLELSVTSAEEQIETHDSKDIESSILSITVTVSNPSVNEDAEEKAESASMNSIDVKSTGDSVDTSYHEEASHTSVTLQQEDHSSIQTVDCKASQDTTNTTNDLPFTASNQDKIEMNCVKDNTASRCSSHMEITDESTIALKQKAAWDLYDFDVGGNNSSNDSASSHKPVATSSTQSNQVKTAAETQVAEDKSADGVPLDDGFKSYTNNIVILYDNVRRKFHILSRKTREYPEKRPSPVLGLWRNDSTFYSPPSSYEQRLLNTFDIDDSSNHSQGSSIQDEHDDVKVTTSPSCQEDKEVNLINDELLSASAYQEPKSLTSTGAPSNGNRAMGVAKYGSFEKEHIELSKIGKRSPAKRIRFSNSNSKVLLTKARQNQKCRLWTKTLTMKQVISKSEFEYLHLRNSSALISSSLIDKHQTSEIKTSTSASHVPKLSPPSSSINQAQTLKTDTTNDIQSQQYERSALMKSLVASVLQDRVATKAALANSQLNESELKQSSYLTHTQKTNVFKYYGKSYGSTSDNKEKNITFRPSKTVILPTRSNANTLSRNALTSTFNISSPFQNLTAALAAKTSVTPVTTGIAQTIQSLPASTQSTLQQSAKMMRTISANTTLASAWIGNISQERRSKSSKPASAVVPQAAVSSPKVVSTSSASSTPATRSTLLVTGRQTILPKNSVLYVTNQNSADKQYLILLPPSQSIDAGNIANTILQSNEAILKQKHNDASKSAPAAPLRSNQKILPRITEQSFTDESQNGGPESTEIKSNTSTPLDKPSSEASSKKALNGAKATQTILSLLQGQSVSMSGPSQENLTPTKSPRSRLETEGSTELQPDMTLSCRVELEPMEIPSSNVDERQPKECKTSSNAVSEEDSIEILSSKVRLSVFDLNPAPKSRQTPTKIGTITESSQSQVPRLSLSSLEYSDNSRLSAEQPITRATYNNKVYIIKQPFVLLEQLPPRILRKGYVKLPESRKRPYEPETDIRMSLRTSSPAGNTKRLRQKPGSLLPTAGTRLESSKFKIETDGMTHISITKYPSNHR